MSEPPGDIPPPREPELDDAIDGMLDRLRRKQADQEAVARSAPLPPGAAPAIDWQQQLRHNKEGRLSPSLHNVSLILQNHEIWRGVIAHDLFAGRILKRKPPPWGGPLGEWADIDDTRLMLWLSSHWGIEPKQEVIIRCVEIAAEDNAYHEVRDYLSALKWDGVPRLSMWLAAYVGAIQSDYCAAVGTKWLVSAVARAFQPGCKADHVLILEGDQGAGKSTALRILFGQWFTDAPFRLGDREGWMTIRGKWGIELSELDSFNRAETTAAKAFFSQSEDRYRTPWGKRPADVRRSCVFAGTTNQSIYLRDESGNRRYWPVRCGIIDLEELRADRDQLWAEAVHRYQQGIPWHVTSEERALFEAEQEARLIPDAYETQITRWLRESPEVNVVTMADVLQKALQLDPGKWTRVEQTRVGQVMSRLDWPRIRSSSGSREWYYVRPVRASDGGPIDHKATAEALKRHLNPT